MFYILIYIIIINCYAIPIILLNCLFISSEWIICRHQLVSCIFIRAFMRIPASHVILSANISRIWLIKIRSSFVSFLFMLLLIEIALKHADLPLWVVSGWLFSYFVCILLYSMETHRFITNYWDKQIQQHERSIYKWWQIYSKNFQLDGGHCSGFA